MQICLGIDVRARPYFIRNRRVQSVFFDDVFDILILKRDKVEVALPWRLQDDHSSPILGLTFSSFSRACYLRMLYLLKYIASFNYFILRRKHQTSYVFYISHLALISGASGKVQALDETTTMMYLDRG